MTEGHVDYREKRQNLRVVFRVECTVEPMVEGLEPFKADSTRDISLKGLYVETAKRLPVDTPCTLRLRLSGTTSELILTIKAKVVRTDGQGMAFLFESIDIDSFFHLKNILYYNSGDPARIDEEIVSIKG